MIAQGEAATLLDPATDLIFGHAGSVELVTRRKFKEKKKKRACNQENNKIKQTELRWRRRVVTQILGITKFYEQNKPPAPPYVD